jgi:hypothetical protein
LQVRVIYSLYALEAKANPVPLKLSVAPMNGISSTFQEAHGESSKWKESEALIIYNHQKIAETHLESLGGDRLRVSIIFTICKTHQVSFEDLNGPPSKALSRMRAQESRGLTSHR